MQHCCNNTFCLSSTTTQNSNMNVPTPKASTVQLPMVVSRHAAPLPRVSLAYQPVQYDGPPRVVPKAPLPKLYRNNY
eukprot:11051235-Ditylum_brightwellii.AAC.1